MRRIIAGAVIAGGLAVSAMAQSNTVTEMAAPAAPPPAPKTWVDNLTVSGDLRYRYESINDDASLNSSKETYTRERDRIRARLAVTAKCNDDLTAKIQLSTGQSDPVSGNQTIGDEFNKKDEKLDLAYMDYCFTGDSANEVRAYAGKMKNPFMTMPDDLVWDPDTTPEGAALKAQVGSGKVKLLANGGYLWIVERSSSPDTMLYAGQAALAMSATPEVTLTLGGSYYGYQDIQGKDVLDWQGANNSYGNSTTKGTVSGSTTNKAWASQFTPVVFFAQLDLWAGKTPIAIFAQDLSNQDASSLDKGHMFGATIGKAKNPKTCELGYTYAELQKDATVGMFTDSDRWGGGTDGKGSKIYGKYQIAKNLQGAVTYFVDKKKISAGSSDTDYNRLQVDLLATF